MENRVPGFEQLLREAFPKTGRALTIGLTGPPGVGKSTLASRLTTLFRAEGLTVAVLAVDPSSPFTGGAILGDRVRMTDHHADPGVFVRSVATRGQLGGIAAAVSDITLLLDAAGVDVILVETAGAGQSEIDIVRVASVTVVVLVPGLGDDVQAMKAGMMEIADLFLLNKSDLPGADRAAADVTAAADERPVIRCSATAGTGLEQAVAAIRSAHHKATAERAVAAWMVRLQEMYRERASRALASFDIGQAARDVVAHKRDPWSVTEEWMKGASQR